MNATPRDPVALYAEALFGSIGLSPLLDQSAPPVKITRSDLRAAEAAPARIARAISRFVSRADLERDAPDEVPFAVVRCVELVAGSPAPEEIADRVVGLPREIAVPFFDVAGRALTLLRDNAPAVSVQTLTGLVRVKPGLVATSRFRRVWTTVEAPDSVFADLLSGVVSREQVTALEIVFPEMYDLARQQVLLSVAAEKARVQSFTLSPRKDRVLQTFLKARSLDPRLAAEIAKIYEGGDIDKNGDPTQAPEQPGIAPKLPQETPSRAQELEAR